MNIKQRIRVVLYFYTSIFAVMLLFYGCVSPNTIITTAQGGDASKKTPPISTKIDIPLKQTINNTPKHVIVENNIATVVKSPVESYSNTSERENSKWTPRHSATEFSVKSYATLPLPRKDASMAEYLMSIGIDVGIVIVFILSIYIVPRAK